jgi:hypothetical protein
MKKKIIGIFVCIMLMTSFLTAARNVEKGHVIHVPEEINTLSFDEDNAPIWKKGNEWTYKLDSITADFEQQNLTVYLKGKVDNLSLKVDEVTGDSYILKFNAPISGNFTFATFFGIDPINITGELKRTTIGGFITFNKTDLGLKQANITIDGRVSLRITEIPIFPLLPLIRIPIPLTAILDINLGDPYPIIDFPINTSKNWGLPATNVSLAGTVKSIWLNILGFINDKIRIPGRIERLATFLQEKGWQIDPIMLKAFSDILCNLTPVVNIKNVLNQYLGGNVFEVPEVPPVFLCLGRDNVTVPVGTFYAYNISTLVKGLANIYYAPVAGNIVKIVGNFEGILPYISNINAELTSYEYNP